MRCRGLAYFDAAAPLAQPIEAGATPVKAVSVAAGAACQRRVIMNSVAPGKEAWKARLPVGSQGTPISYQSPVTGQQFVLISAGGARNAPDRGDHVIAYALPR